MLSMVGRLDQLTQMLDQGLLCKCDNWDVDGPKDYGNEPEANLIHESNCQGRVKFMELLNADRTKST